QAKRSSDGFVEHLRASKDMEAATCASFNNRRPSFTNRAPTAAITDVPLMIANPSLDCRTRGDRFALARAFSPGRICPSTSASPSPISTRPMWARGARSPLAPSEPRDGITGWTPRFRTSRRRVTRPRRTPPHPFFGLQEEGGQVRLGEGLLPGQDLSIDLRVAFANQYEAHVGQGSQVAARTERAAGRDHRMDAAVQELQEAGHEDPTDAGVAH